MRGRAGRKCGRRKYGRTRGKREGWRYRGDRGQRGEEFTREMSLLFSCNFVKLSSALARESFSGLFFQHFIQRPLHTNQKISHIGLVKSYRLFYLRHLSDE